MFIINAYFINLSLPENSWPWLEFNIVRWFIPFVGIIIKLISWINFYLFLPFFCLIFLYFLLFTFFLMFLLFFYLASLSYPIHASLSRIFSSLYYLLLIILTSNFQNILFSSCFPSHLHFFILHQNIIKISLIIGRKLQTFRYLRNKIMAW